MSISTLPALPDRPDDGHKGTFGRATIVGGCTGMAGSVSLAGMGALRSGAGLVSLAVPDVILPTVAAFEPSYLTISISSDSHGRISYDALTTLESRLATAGAGAIGPGLGRSEDLDRMVNQLYRTSVHPLVFDADALNALADQPDVLQDHVGIRILTPHPGEFARLIRNEASFVQKNRESLALQFAADHKVILVLKGAGTIVTDGFRVYTNDTGNSGMGTGGTGDVLTGVIVSLLAQGMSAFEAAQLGVYAHGIAGDLAAEELSKRAMIATDLLEFLPYAWKLIDNAA